MGFKSTFSHIYRVCMCVYTDIVVFCSHLPASALPCALWPILASFLPSKYFLLMFSLKKNVTVRISYFSVTMIEYRDQGILRKSLLEFDIGFQRDERPFWWEDHGRK